MTKLLYALDGDNGRKKWDVEIGAMSSSSAIGIDGTIYIGTWDGKLLAINGTTGTKLWEFKAGALVSSPAIGKDATLYFGSGDGNVYALKITSQGLAQSPWPMVGQNPQHTGRAP